MAVSNIDKSYENIPKLGRTGGARQRFQPVDRPQNARVTLFRLMKIFILWRRSLLLAMVFTILSAGFSLFTPYLIGRAINSFDIETNIVNKHLLMMTLILMVSCYLLSWIIDTFNGTLMARVSQQLVRHIRQEVFSKLQKIPLNFYDTTANGDTMSRITNDVDNISSTIAQTTTQLMSSLCFLAGAFIMMLILSPILTLLALLVIPLFMLCTRIIAGNSQKYFLGQQQKLGQLNGIVEENIVGLKMVKAFNRQQSVLAGFSSANRDLCRYATRAQIWSGFMMPFMNVINNLCFGLIACAGGILTLRGSVSIGVVVSFLTYSKQFSQPLNNIAGMLNTIQSALAGAERVFQIMDENEEAADQPEAKVLVNPQGKVEFRDVSFAYTDSNMVLKNINFQVRPGEAVALVGETGAGKTTIVNLLTRFYETAQGKVLIDDIDITDLSRTSLRSCFSVVLQDTSLFTGTIYDNIRYSRPSASDREVREAARTAHADEFIARLPQGYETMVSGSADTLSQGQRQLLAIARAILCDAPILILDEATSSVDTKTEKEIQLALMKLLKNRTSFLIAHRLSTIRDADKIMVISAGKIVESGTHGELMQSKGLYYQTVLSQIGYIKEESK
jgi:ABC-type multidrug transport system, ATPase and permease components